MFHKKALLSAFAALAAAQSAPSVTIKDGTVVGSTTNNIDSFKGIPFAEPPVGSLRLKPPTPLQTGFGTIQATGTPKTCPQFFTSSTPDGPFLGGEQGAFGPQGEDCLTLNVQRPAGAKEGDKLPVLVWIFGGGFELGATSQYGGDVQVGFSQNLSKPIVYVEMNYRLAGFGFLGGKEVKADGSSNLGLRDQRLALEWVQDNIEKFGGDPGCVTIWGESAGAISATDQILINDGDNTYNGKPLFHGSFQDSGSIIPANDVASAKPQAIYDQVVKNANCTEANDTLECLRQAPYETFYRATTEFPSILSYYSLDLTYLPRPDNSSAFFRQPADTAVIQGKYAKVPVIVGDQEDEGTLFAMYASNLTTTQDVIDYFAHYFPGVPQDKLAQLVDAYPEDPADGSPFHTGDLYATTPQSKRLAAILGDISFTLIRRAYLAIIYQTVPTWSYLATYYRNTTALGTSHGSDLPVIRSTTPSVMRDSYLTFLISFVNFKDPNAIKNEASNVEWPRWNFTGPDGGAKLLNFEKNQTSIIGDDFRVNEFYAITGETGVLRI